MNYPTQEVLLKQWQSHVSHWIRNISTDFNDHETEIAKLSPNSDRIKELLSSDDSEQRVFDIYGAAMTLEMLGDSIGGKYLLEELAKIVPYAGIYVEISNFCKHLGLLSERVENLEKALEKDPENAIIWNYLGSAFVGINEKSRGIKLLQKSVEKMPEFDLGYSNYLFDSHYAEDIDCTRLFENHKRWGEFHAPKDSVMSDHKNVADPGRKLRIGYISPDFRWHPVGQLIQPILDNHDRNNIEVFGYGNITRRTSFSSFFENSFDHYHDIFNLNDASVVEMIMNDSIDILVDLAGHTAGNRLKVLACKPAPVQASYLGYFDTTGMEQIDYFLTDSCMSRPESQQYHTEEIFALPHTCFCYNVLTKKLPVTASPVIENGHITFGMYSNPSKITLKTAKLWSRIMQNTANSRLKLIMKDGKNEQTASIYLKLLEEAGIPKSRVDIQGSLEFGEYFGEYNAVDIILDTYPYNGGITTCDAFSMGVPVVSLVGEHHFSRVGLSLLTSVGLDYFACKTEDEYVAKASVLAAKPEALANIRGTLRQRMQASAMCDMKLQTKGIEDAYREMWRRWCEKQTNNA